MLTAGQPCSYFVLMTIVIDSIGKAARHGMIVRAECQCGNLRYFKARDLLPLVGSARPLQSIRFSCRQCRPNRITVTALEIDADRLPRILVWRPEMRQVTGIVWTPHKLR